MLKYLITLAFLCISQLHILAIQNNGNSISPENFGCVSDDISYSNENSVNFQKAIDYCISNGMVLKSSPRKKYYISKGLVINGFIDIDLGCATLVATDTIDVITVRNSKTEYWSGSIRNFRIDLNKKGRNGIKCENVIKLNIIDGEIVGIGKDAAGLLVKKGYELIVNRLHLHGSEEFSTGIKTQTGDCHFSDCVIINCYTSIDNHGCNFYERVHAWMLSDIIKGSTFLKNRGGLVFMSQCFCDTFDNAISILNSSNIHLTQFRLFHNKIMWKGIDNREINPTLFVYLNKKVYDNTSVNLIDSHIGGLMINNVNRQKISNINSNRVNMVGTTIIN